MMIPIGTWIRWLTVKGPMTGMVYEHTDDGYYLVSLERDDGKSVKVHPDSVRAIG